MAAVGPRVGSSPWSIQKAAIQTAFGAQNQVLQACQYAPLLGESAGQPIPVQHTGSGGDGAPFRRERSCQTVV
eukprot:CAMPEP_0117692486 /NCGR_PEP_ID=MMETSP0804-20121206/26357_1 /TAXON_ID=1074897 /ORGANISM="Tetraselmis astigmatica, Strain CCMP880" /LENGTH=72 /DNA_ID=CAMNT_0005505945 /DNA_START=90 /DNA_END=309 /DNA_ORIENTATION=-